MQSILDFRWLLFVQEADAGSVSGAALALDMPQSVVSRHISKLEGDFGGRLFRRTGRGVVLTEFGLQVYPKIMSLIKDAEQLADDMRSSGGTPMGDVRVGLLPSAVSILAGPLFTGVRKSWPGIRLHLTEGSSAQLEEWVTLGRLDMALVLREEDSAAPDETVLAKLPLYLIVPARHLLASRKTIGFEEVSGLPLVLPSEPHPLRARLAKLAKETRVTITQVVEADSIGLQHEIVASEGGFAITAGILAPRDARRLVAVRIVRPSLSRSIVLVVTSHRAQTRATWEVSRLLKSLAPPILKSQTRT